MPMSFSEDSTARVVEVPRADPTTAAAATPAAVWLRNSRRFNCFDGEALFIDKRVWRSCGRPAWNVSDESYGRLGHLLSILQAAIVQRKKFGWSACILVCNLLVAK